MKKVLFTPLVLGLALTPAFGADPIVTPPAVPPVNVTAPTTNPSSPAASAVEAERIVVPLRTLTVVKNARESRTPWQQSADEAVARINDPSLKANVRQQLSAVAPQAAKLLMQQPGENAIITIAVYKQRGSDRQMLAAVAFEGVGEALNPSFYARVLANSPQLPGADDKLAEKLEFDPAATSYLCLFIDHGDLKGDDITNAQMKKSLDIGIEQGRQADEVVASGPGSQAALNQQQIEEQQRQAANAQAQPAQPASANDASDYTTPYWDTNTADSVPYYGVDGWIPWYSYVPDGGQAAIVVRPDFNRREHWRRQQAAAPANARDPVARDRREENSALDGVRRPAQNPPRLILPSAPRNVRQQGPMPVEPRTPQGPLQGAHEPGQEQAAPAREAAPAHSEAAPAHEAPAPARK